MGRLFVSALVVGMLVPAGRASGQERLTLRQALEEALSASPRIRAAEAAADQARAGARAARAAFFPQVSFSESWQRSNQPVFAFSSLLASRAFTQADFGVDRLNEPKGVAAFASRLFISQVLFDGRVRAESSLEADRTNAAEAALAAARADLTLEITRAYGRVLTAAADMTSAEAAARAAQEDLDRAERRRLAGMVTDADVLALSVHLAAMERRRIAASGDAEIARADLNRLTGAPVTRAFAPDEPPAPAEVSPALDDLVERAEAARPELRRRQAERRAAEAGTRMARAGWWPRVTAQAGYQLEGLDMFDRRDSWIVGGELTWQLSLGGAERARSAGAAAALAAADAALDETRAAVQLDVVTALATLRTARARTDVGRRAVDEAVERERITRNRYEAGLASVNDVLAASAARLDAETERVAALVDAIVASAMLDRAVGRPIGPSHP